MTIDFSVGDWVLPNEAYLKTLQESGTTLKQTLITLGNLLEQPSEVMAVGNLTFPVRSFIRVRPKNVQHAAYKGGSGVVIYFSTDTELNNSFESSEAYLKDQEVVKAYNNSGSSISKNEVVRQTGFSSSEQLPTLAKAAATTATNAIVLGIAQEDIANGASGNILLDGSFQVDTSSYTLGAISYLSDTPGALSTSAGTVSTNIGRVLSVGTEGTISLFSVLTGSVGGSSNGGGGGGGGGITGDVEVKTSDYEIVAADDGKTFTNDGAGDVVTFTETAAGLPVGLTFTLCRVANYNVEFRPASSVQNPAVASGSNLFLDAGISLLITSGPTSIIWKKISSTKWIIINEVVNMSPEVVQLEASEIISMTLGPERPEPATDYAWSIVQNAAPNAILGTVDEGDEFVQGETLGGLEVIYIRFVNNPGSDATAEWRTDVSVSLDGTFNAVGQPEIMPTFDTIEIPVGEEKTFWVDTAFLQVGLYLRNTNGGEVIPWDTAKSSPL